MMFTTIVRRNNLARLISNNNNININNSSLLLHVFGGKKSCDNNVCYYLSTLSTTTNTSVFEFLSKKHNFSAETATHVASTIATTFKNHEKPDSLFSFLKHDIGFTKSQLEKTLKLKPCLLLASPDKTIKPKIKILQDFGFSLNDIADIISKEPAILFTSARNRIIPSLHSLKVLFGSSVEVIKAVRKCGWLLLADLDKTMFPNIEFLRKSCGMTTDQIMCICDRLPRFLLCRPEYVRNAVETVDGMGVDKSSKVYLYAVCAVGSMTIGKWDMKLQAFRNNLEFSDDDILRVVKECPVVFAVSVMYRYPMSVMYSVEKRWKPRFHVLEVLENRGIITKWPSLSTIATISDDKFFKRFVHPHSIEVGDMYKHRVIKR